jgi:hypothetical protein
VSSETRQGLLDFLNGDDGFTHATDDPPAGEKVRAMLHIIMSLPNHQLA